MKAAVFHGAGQPLSIETVPDPVPGPEDLIIRVHRCGICGTDINMTAGGSWSFPKDSVPGHEYAGEVAAVGSAVSGFRVGDRVTALPSQGCRHCLACETGNYVLCHSMPGLMGGFGEYLRIPAYLAVKLPSTFSQADGALMEPFAVGLYGVRTGEMKRGDRVLVLGGGTVALTAIFWARRLGAGRIVALSRSARRADLALAMGADTFVTAGPEDVKEAAAALGGAADVVYECVGVPGQIQRGVQHARVLGHVVSLGFCTSPDTFLPAVAAYKGVRMSFPVGYALQDFHRAADEMLAGKVDPKQMITKVVPLEDLPTAFEALRAPNQETKVQVRFAAER